MPPPFGSQSSSPDIVCNCGVGLAEFTNTVFSVFSISVCKFANRSKSSSGSGLWEHVHNFTIKSHFVIYVSILLEEKHYKCILKGLSHEN